MQMPATAEAGLGKPGIGKLIPVSPMAGRVPSTLSRTCHPTPGPQPRVSISRKLEAGVDPGLKPKHSDRRIGQSALHLSWYTNACPSFRFRLCFFFPWPFFKPPPFFLGFYSFKMPSLSFRIGALSERTWVPFGSGSRCSSGLPQFSSLTKFSSSSLSS